MPPEIQDKSSTSTVPSDVHVSSVAYDSSERTLKPDVSSDKTVKPADNQTEKKSKKEKEKEKDKGTKMIYSDNETCPEEKMAKLSRYAFNPQAREETVLGDAATAAVSGVERGYEAAYNQD